MQEPSLEENALTAHIKAGRLRIERRTLDPKAVGTARVIGPDGQAETVPLRDVSPGKAVGETVATLPGVWQVTDGEHVAYAASDTANPMEIADLRATATVIGSLAHASGGGVHWLGTAAKPDVPDLRRTEPDHPASGGSWVGLQRRHDHIVTGIASVPLLPAWLSLPAILGLMLLAWRREGR
jgi:hypothetical protein